MRRLEGRRRSSRAAQWLVIVAAGGFPTGLVGQVGVETRFGTSSTSGLEGGWSWAVDLSLGRLGSTPVSPFFGIERTHNTISEDFFFGPLEGDVGAWAGRAGIRLDPAAFGRISPFVTVALVGQNTTISLPDVAGDLEATAFDGGFEVGLDLGAGLAWALDARERFALVAGLRKLIAGSHDPFGLQIGVRITPAGRRPDAISSAQSYDLSSDAVPTEESVGTGGDLDQAPRTGCRSTVLILAGAVRRGSVR